MLNGDWIRLHRKLLDSQVFSNFDLLGVWVWCLLRANWKDGWFCGEVIKAGSFATGKERGSMECRLSPSAWYRRIQTLESMGMISRKSNNRFTIITICQWKTYQNDQIPERTTNGQPADNQRTTSGQPADTIEEGKERKEGKEEIHAPKKLRTASVSGFDLFWKAYPKKSGGKEAGAKAFQAAVKRLKEDVRFQDQNPVEFLIAKAVEFATTPKGQSGQFCPYPATWLNKGFYDDDPVTWLESRDQGPKPVPLPRLLIDPFTHEEIPPP